MGFDKTTCAVLDYYTNKHAPYVPEGYYGPWIAILTSLFPPSNGYIVYPYLCSYNTGERQEPELTFRVAIIRNDPKYAQRTVLLVQSRARYRWPDGKEAFERLIDRRAQSAFRESGWTSMAVYWIAALGTHWRYGKKEDEYEAKTYEDSFLPLIDWQETIHDETSYHHLCALAREIEQME